VPIRWRFPDLAARVAERVDPHAALALSAEVARAATGSIARRLTSPGCGGQR
jgi:hypothetical protein